MSGAARAGPARLAALALLTCSLWPARADNASQEYYTALINVTVQEPGRGAPLTFRIDRGRYGLDSPKAEVRGQVLAPLPIHGGECRAAESGGRARGGAGAGDGPHPGRGSWGAGAADTAPPPRPGSQLRSAGGTGAAAWVVVQPGLLGGWRWGSCGGWGLASSPRRTRKTVLFVEGACLREDIGLRVCGDS